MVRSVPAHTLVAHPVDTRRSGLHPLIPLVQRLRAELPAHFDSTQQVLEHLLLSVGNGFLFDDEKGLPYLDTVEGRRYLDEFDPLDTEAKRREFICECHQAIRYEIEMFYGLSDLPTALESIEAQIMTEQNRCVLHDVSAAEFSAARLYNDLCRAGHGNTVYGASDSLRDTEAKRLLRPTCLDHRQVYLFRITERSPRWLIETGLNLCRAWIQFLDEEIIIGNVRPEIPGRPHPEDPTGTRKARTILAGAAERLAALMFCNISAR